MKMMMMAIPMHSMDTPPKEEGMSQRGKECPEEQCKKICPDCSAPSIQIEDPINGSDTKSIEIGMFGPRWE